MNEIQTNYSNIVLDLGSGVTKAGFSGEDAPRSVFSSIVGIPKKSGMLVGMEQNERLVGAEGLNEIDVMDFNYPIQRGEVVNWDKLETLMHHVFYKELKVVPEEISIVVSYTPLISKECKAKLAEMLFELFNVERIYLANSSMLGMYSYGCTSAMVLDSGFETTSVVPVYEGYPLSHASQRINYAGNAVTTGIQAAISLREKDTVFENMKGSQIAEKIKESLSFVSQNIEEDSKMFEDEQKQETYVLPDKKTIKLKNELFSNAELLFNPAENTHKSIKQLVEASLANCDEDIRATITSETCLVGGNSLIKGFDARLCQEIPYLSDKNRFQADPDRMYSNWIGGSILSSLNNFDYTWVSKKDYDESKDPLKAVETKCF